MQKLSSSNRRIILASGSPRRRELTRRIGLEPVVIVSDVPEVKEASESPADYTRRLAFLKAQGVAQKLASGDETADWILAADTIVVLDGDVLEKPVDTADARRMLQRLSGNTHTVITSFCWWSRSAHDGSERMPIVRSVEADVVFRELDDAMIDSYLATGESMDKAGSYGVQDIGSTLVRKIDGSYFCVVGLPVCEIVESLQEVGAIDNFPFPSL